MSKFSIPFYDDVLHVTVTKEAYEVHRWICSICTIHNHASAQLLVGIDTEWLPNLTTDEDHPVATLQLCVGKECLIFQILHSDFIPQTLQLFLADQRHTFCGVGVEDDVEKLYDNYRLCVGRTADLNDLARMAGIDGLDLTEGGEYKYMGLKSMALALLGKKMEKPLSVTMSKWDADKLDNAQIEYAAIDAAVSFQLGFLICIRLFHPNPALTASHPVNELVSSLRATSIDS